MRPVPGFERPILQWMFIAAGAILVATAATGAIALRRLHADVEQLRAADLNARVERQSLELRLSQEQSARESFALEAARSRAGAAAAAAEPTLTLTPARLRSGAPPAPTVAQPPPTQTIMVRLVLPAAKADADRRYTAMLRGWSGGEVLWSRGDLRASIVEGRAMVAARITGDALIPGAYELVLSSGQTAGGAATETTSYEVAVAVSVDRF